MFELVKGFAIFGDPVDHMYNQTSRLMFTFHKSRLMFNMRKSRLMFTVRKSRLMFTVCKSRLMQSYAYKYCSQISFYFWSFGFITRVSIHLSRRWAYYFGL